MFIGWKWRGSDEAICAIKQPCAVVGRRDQRFACQGPRGIDTGQASHGSRFGVAFYAHELPGKKERAASLELQRVQQELGRIDERIAMEASIAEKLSLFQPRDHAKHALLFAIGQFGLKADQVVAGAMNIFCSQLDDGSRSTQFEDLEAHRFHRPNCIVWRPRSASTSSAHRPQNRASFRIPSAGLFRGHHGIVKGIVLSLPSWAI